MRSISRQSRFVDMLRIDMEGTGLYRSLSGPAVSILLGQPPHNSHHRREQANHQRADCQFFAQPRPRPFDCPALSFGGRGTPAPSKGAAPLCLEDPRPQNRRQQAASRPPQYIASCPLFSSYFQLLHIPIPYPHPPRPSRFYYCEYPLCQLFNSLQLYPFGHHAYFPDPRRTTRTFNNVQAPPS